MKPVIRKMQETAAESGLWERLRREGWNITEELESVQKSHSRSNGGEVCLVVTDTLEGASYAKERNLACLGLERPKTGCPFLWCGHGHRGSFRCGGKFSAAGVETPLESAMGDCTDTPPGTAGERIRRSGGFLPDL